jgi:hypothetical protein
MASAKECDRGRIIHWSFWLLSKIHKRFSKIVSPITSLQKKGVNFNWNSKCEESFQ